MLDGAFTSPKIRRLAAILDVPWPHALGLCGLLWRFTAKHAPTGEIGLHGDEEIACALEWPRDAETLINALHRSRLIDVVPCECVRFVVHDWPDHAPRYVAATLARRGLEWSPWYAGGPDWATDATVVATTSTSSSSLALPSSHTLTFPDADWEREESEEGEEPEADRPTSYDAASAIEDSGRLIRRPNGSDAGGGLLKRRTAQDEIPADRVEAIWSAWVPGRKTGKRKAVEAIRVSTERLVDAGATVADALDAIEAGTRRDADVFAEAVAAGRLALRFVPYGVTYFTQERWADDAARKETDDVDDQIRRLAR